MCFRSILETLKGASTRQTDTWGILERLNNYILMFYLPTFLYQKNCLRCVQELQRIYTIS